MEWPDAIIREKKHDKSKVDDCNLLFCLADLFTSSSQKGKEKSRMEAEYMMLWMRDQENIERGIEQGLKQGIEQGIKQGMRRGRKQGRQEGMKQQRRDIILRMIDQGLSDKQIKSLCNSSNKEISECRASVQKELNTMTD